MTARHIMHFRVRSHLAPITLQIIAVVLEVSEENVVVEINGIGF
jgi:hypothetical protein